MIDDFFTTPFPLLNIDDDFLLREQEVKDSVAFLSYYSDPHVGQHILATKPQTLVDATAEIHYCRSLFQYKKGIYWALARKSDDQMIGAIGVYINTYHSRGEICYDLNFDYWNRGIMTKAMQTAITYCFRGIGLIRLEAITLAANVSSIALLKKLDFHYEGTLKKYRYYNENFHDIELYARIAPKGRVEKLL